MAVFLVFQPQSRNNHAHTVEESCGPGTITPAITPTITLRPLGSRVRDCSNHDLKESLKDILAKTMVGAITTPPPRRLERDCGRDRGRDRDTASRLPNGMGVIVA